ncbi:MAG TPA: hypothetical protein V6C65_26185 [Allocoleopsis sp.]
MAKSKSPNGFSGTAVTAMKVDDGSGLLAIAVKLTIIDGKVSGFEILNSPNLPAASIGQCQTQLWSMIRQQTISPDNLRVGVQ